MGCIVIVFIYVILIFNGLIKARNLVAAAWADIDVQLQRRHDLVPQLVEIVRAYVKHERDTLQAVVQQRDAAVRAATLSEKAGIETILERTIHQLMVIAEDYPDLKAGENFRDLSDNLVNIEDHLQFSRRFYNGAVRDFNIRIERVPDRLLAGPLGFKAAEFFQAEAESRGAINVGDLS
ncbi:LemA family protein [Spartinivicinus ruber]|uniref:LemA family protein n=1 Tax=Spartinivicinus ruber TaxID=2683272 RepID=UPI001CA45E6E|nr:LemA family protein [Spartinivicinus ruber]